MKQTTKTSTQKLAKKITGKQSRDLGADMFELTNNLLETIARKALSQRLVFGHYSDERGDYIGIIVCSAASIIPYTNLDNVKSLKESFGNCYILNLIVPETEDEHNITIDNLAQRIAMREFTKVFDVIV